MKNTCKILALVLVLMMMFAMASMFTASAAAPDKLYLTPNANWKSEGARFAAYFFGNGEKWVSMTDSDKDGVYEVDVPAGFPNVIFCRMNPNATANNWNNKYNQTADLVIPTSGANHYTVKEGTWDKGGGTWSTFGSTCAHANLGEAATCTTPQKCLDCGDPVVSELGHTYNSAHLCTRCNVQATFTVAGSGAHMNGEWAPGNTANDMTYADGVYTKVYTNVAAGSYMLKVARDHDWGTAYPSSDKAYTVATAGSTVTVTLKGTTVDIKVEAPHTHNFVEGKCECGEEDPNYVPPHVNTLVVGETNKIVVSGATLNDYGLPIEWVPFVADENAFYSFVGDNGALAFIFTAEGALVSATGAANLEAGTYLICLGNGLAGEFNVAVTKSAWVNALALGENKILITDAQDNGYGFYISWVPFEVTEKANYTFTGEGILALVYDAAYGAVTGTELEVGTYNICIAFLTPATTGVATVKVEKTAIVPEYNWWVSDGSFYTVEGDTIKYNGAGNTYACVGCDVTALAAGKNTFTITITNNGAAAARVRVDLQATVQVGNHKVVNTEAVGGDVWTDAEWGGSIVTVPAGESVTLVITYDETTERGAVKDLIIFADSARGDAETYATDITVSGMEFSAPAAEDPALVLGDNTVVIDGTTVNFIGNAVAWYTFTPEVSGTYTFASEELTPYIYAEKDMGTTALGTGVADLEAGVTYYILVGKGGITGEFTVNVSAGGVVVAPNTIVVGDNHYVITDTLLAVGFEFIEFTVAEPGTYVVTGGAPMKVYVFTLPNTDLGTAGAGAFGWNVDAMEESGFASSFEVTLPEAGTYWFGVNYEYVTTEREFDINISLKEVEEPEPENPEPENPETEDPKTEAPEMNFFEKIIAWFSEIIMWFVALFGFKF